MKAICQLLSIAAGRIRGDPCRGELELSRVVEGEEWQVPREQRHRPMGAAESVDKSPTKEDQVSARDTVRLNPVPGEPLGRTRRVVEPPLAFEHQDEAVGVLVRVHWEIDRSR